MRLPKALENLVEEGVIQEVIRPLMSGKEAQLYLVMFEDHPAAAKVYKDAQNRSFKHRSDYMDGRTVRNTRDQRAMQSGSKYGRAKDEEAWRATEVDMIYRLHAGGVRVPVPYTYMDGVLVMELVTDEQGNPAPRLGDLDPTPEEAVAIYHHLIGEVVRMLAVGVVHGDLSDFNVLYGADGPVVIDFPQSILAANNQNARSILIRDVANLHRFVRRFSPNSGGAPYAEEMWKLYETNRLSADTVLTGRYQGATAKVDTRAVMQLIGDAKRDEQRRREQRGGPQNPNTARQSLALETKETPESTSGAPVRRRIVEIVPANPRPRGGRPSPEAARSTSGHNRGQAHSGRAPGASYPQGAPESAPPARRPKTGPKRGDQVKASTYVSPAARLDTFRLTPRNAAPELEQGRNEVRSQLPGSQGNNPRRRRRRGGKNRQVAPGASPPAANQTTAGTPKTQTSAPANGGSTSPRKRRRRPRRTTPDRPQ